MYSASKTNILNMKLKFSSVSEISKIKKIVTFLKTKQQGKNEHLVWLFDYETVNSERKRTMRRWHFIRKYINPSTCASEQSFVKQERNLAELGLGWGNKYTSIGRCFKYAAVKWQNKTESTFMNNIIPKGVTYPISSLHGTFIRAGHMFYDRVSFKV